MKITTLRFTILMAVVAATLCTTKIHADEKYNQINADWQTAISAAIDSFPQNGGYYTGRNSNSQFRRTAWRAMNEAFGMQPTDSQPRLDLSHAQPSFGTMATYLALLKALQIWDANSPEYSIPNLSWFSMKPFCGVTDIINSQGYNQADGEGLWGMANANGPGIAILVKELDAGFSFTGYRGAKTEKYKENKNEQYLSDDDWNNAHFWNYARKGDFMKIFWNRNESDGSDSGAIIGDNGKPADEQEIGHCAIFLGYDDNGNVVYWSSNNSEDAPTKAGYGIATCPRTSIQRIVFTRITKPEKFVDAKKWRANKKHKWLNELAGKRHGTTKELKKYCDISD